jgi:hypothetical protein
MEDTMRSNWGRSRLPALVLTALAVGLAAPAVAGPRQHAGPRLSDRVYADPFGNLVIDSASGYKRILVGEGKAAREWSGYTGAGHPRVVYDSESDEIGMLDCYRPPVFVKGRSYMYGLSDGEMPELSPCR